MKNKHVSPRNEANRRMGGDQILFSHPQTAVLTRRVHFRFLDKGGEVDVLAVVLQLDGEERAARLAAVTSHVDDRNAHKDNESDDNYNGDGCHLAGGERIQS